MALPITYHGTTWSNGLDGRTSSYYDLYQSKQARPYDLPATYKMVRGYTVAAEYYGALTNFASLANVGVHKGVLGWGPDVNSTFGLQILQANNNAYEKFSEKVKGVSAMVAVDIAELNTSLKMIADRALQLLLFCEALRRGRFKEAAALLGVQKPESFRKLAKKGFANQFLEFHFGWEPLIGDIGAAVDILQKDPKDKRVQCRGKRVDKHLVGVENTGGYTYRYECRAKIQTSCSSRVKVSNPMLHMADQLGFVNPAGIAWELVPFSFVVDWFVPVSAFLNSYTDFLGLDMDQTSYFNILRTPVWSYQEWSNDPHFPGGRDIVTTGVYATRTLGIPSVTLVPRRITGISPTRAATAIALLLQQGLR